MAETTNDRSSSKQSAQGLASTDRNAGGLQRDNGRTAASNPFGFMDRMAAEMDRRFDRMLRDFGLSRGWGLPRMSSRAGSGDEAWAPRIEAFQKGDQFIIRADLPGLKKDDVQVDLGEDAITIQGDRREEHEDNRDGYYHSERQYGHFYRSIPLPEGVITESARATFANGVLEVSMQAPPAEASRGRRLEINDSSQSSGNK